jgi:hypothetical protein
LKLAENYFSFNSLHEFCRNHSTNSERSCTSWVMFLSFELTGMAANHLVNSALTYCKYLAKYAAKAMFSPPLSVRRKRHANCSYLARSSAFKC